MRRLLYVPVIHSEADLGSAGAALARESVALWGERRWALHKQTMGKFWQSVRRSLLSLDCRRIKVYQDGLAAEGEVGRRIVEEAAGRGSENYRLVLELLQGGAELRKTEDPLLLLQEQEDMHSAGQPGVAGGKQLAGEDGRRAQRDRLVQERDAFMAQAIGSTLKEGEVGILFVGAHHGVASRLADDISVETVKDRALVQAYFEELLLGNDDERFKGLSRSLASPVNLSPGPGLRQRDETGQALE